MLAPPATLLFSIPFGVTRADGANRYLRNDQRGMAKKREIVQLAVYGTLFDTQSATAVAIMVAPTTLQRTVEKHD